MSASSIPAKPTIAQPGRRLVAALYDGMLVLAMLFFVGAILIVIGTYWLGQPGQAAAAAQPLPTWYQSLVQFPASLLTVWTFYGLFWRKSGQTLGMQTWHLKTVDAQGQLLKWPRVWLRCASATVLPAVAALLAWAVYGYVGAVAFSAFIGWIGNYLLAYTNRRRLALHDILSATITLKMPPGEVQNWQQFWKRLRQGG